MKLTKLQQHYYNTFKFMRDNAYESVTPTYIYRPGIIKKIHTKSNANKHLTKYLRKNNAKLLWMYQQKHNLSTNTNIKDQVIEVLIHINNTPCVLVIDGHNSLKYHIFTNMTEKEWRLFFDYSKTVQTGIGFDTSLQTLQINSDDNSTKQILKTYMKDYYHTYSEEELFQISTVIDNEVMYTTATNIVHKIQEVQNRSVLNIMQTIFNELP